jgi:hypothetical protein
MWSVGDTLGRLFFVAGFLPAFVFVSAVGFVLTPHGAAQWVQDDLTALLATTTIYLLASTLLGLLLLILNKPIIKLFENGFLISRWLMRNNMHRHEKIYTALLARRVGYHKAVEAGVQTEDAIAKLEAVHEKIEQTTHGAVEIPIEVRNIKPTALGNAFAVMEEYPYERYGMDAMVFWPRVVNVLSEPQRAQIADLKTTVDFLLNLSLLAILFGVVAILLGAWTLTAARLGIGLVAIAVGYVLYRMAVGTTLEMAEAVMSSFDLCRHTLLQQFGLPKPTSLLAEQRVWMLLASFVRRGEDFYFPIDVDMEDDHALLRQRLGHHTHNLHLLKQQASVFAAGETPLHLLNQIDSEQKCIEDISAALSAKRAQTENMMEAIAQSTND